MHTSHVDAFLHYPKENITLWLFDVALENDPFIDDFPIKTSIYHMATSNKQRVPYI
jgi:hypothetical protein